MICIVIMLSITFLEIFEARTTVLSDLTKANHITFFMLTLFLAAFQITPAARRAIQLIHVDKVVSTFEARAQRLRAKIETRRG